MRNKKYTVVLIYPDHVAETYGEEFYGAHVMAKTSEEALKLARAEVLAVNKLSSDENDDNYCAPTDFACVRCYRGHLVDFNPE